MSPFQKYLRSVLKGLTLALFIGMVVAVGCEAIAAHATGKPLGEIINASLFAEMGLVASPFAMLAILRIHAWASWIAGLVITFAYWGLVYLPPAMQLGGGVNIGWAITIAFMPIITFVGSMLMLLPQAAKFDGPKDR